VSTSDGELIAFDANTYTELDRTPKIEGIRVSSLDGFSCKNFFVGL